MKNLFRTIVAVGVAPMLWPAAFMGLAFTTKLDPLLGGLQNALYPAGLIWLVTVLLISLIISRLTQRKLTNSAFLMSAVGATVLAGAIFVCSESWGTFQLIGQKGVIYPDHFDWKYAFDQLWHVMLLTVGVSLFTAIFFIGIGGLKFVQPNPK